MARTSILLFGDTGSGKTPQFGELAKSMFLTERKRSRLYTWDEGGIESIKPLVTHGIVQVEDMRGFPYPFDWLDEVTRGKLYRNGIWTANDAAASELGVIGFEGIVEAGDILMREMSDMSARGINIGGGGALSFKSGTKTIGSNNQSHYGQAQGAISAAVKRSFRIPGDGYIVWTSSARRGEDQDNKVTILGPQVIGKALTSEVPRWFSYCFYLAAIEADPLTNAKAEHRLYFRRHTDVTVPGASVLGNDRIPLGVEPLPEYIAPADIVRALHMIASKQAEADALLAREIAALEGPALP